MDLTLYNSHRNLAISQNQNPFDSFLHTTISPENIPSLLNSDIKDLRKRLDELED